MAMELLPTEIELVGRWIASNGRVTSDAVNERITALVGGHLQEVARDASGWDVLYRDPADGRFWELTLPDGHLHGGGPKRLQHVDVAAVAAKYGL